MSKIVLRDDALLRAYAAEEFCERAGISRRSLDRTLARGEINAVPGSRGSGKTLRIPTLELARVLYGDVAAGVRNRDLHTQNPAWRGGAWEIEIGVESVSPSIQSRYEGVLGAIGGTSWRARLVDMHDDDRYHITDVYAMLHRCAKRWATTNSVRVKKGDFFDVVTPQHSNKAPISAGQTIRTQSGQNPLWEGTLAGRTQSAPDNVPIDENAGLSEPPEEGEEETGVATEPAIAFGDLPTVRAMGTGETRIVIGFDSEFTYRGDGSRVVDSYQLSVIDPLDDSIRHEIVILPMEGQRITLEDMLYIVARIAGLHRLSDGLDPRGSVYVICVAKGV